jgi:hypothetical protein
MKATIFYFLGFVFLSNLAFAQSTNESLNPPVDPCQSELAVPNNWLVAVNVGDHASKEELIESLALMSTGGFSLDAIFNYGLPEKTFVLKFNPDYYPSKEHADAVKNKVLDGLAAIPSNNIECNWIVFPL